MKPEFSEFSYGFAFTEAFIRRKGNLRAVPVFPSLRAEGTKGWDVHLKFPGVPFFLQFKLSDLLLRSNAKYWPYYGRPYFRIDITPLSRSRQHNLLKELNDSGHDNVYYAAPFFHTIRQFNEAYLSDEVIQQSLLVPLSQLPPLYDYEAHYVTFTRPNNFSWHTDEQNLEGKLLEGDFSAEPAYERIQNMFNRDAARSMNKEYFTELRDLLVDILNSTIHGIYIPLSTSTTIGQTMDVDETMLEIRYLLTTYFGLEMFSFYQEPNNRMEILR